LQPVTVDCDREQRPVRCAAPLGRAARIEDPDVTVAGDLGEVRVSVDDRVAAGKRSDEPCRAPLAPPGVVHHPDPKRPCLDDEPFGQRRLQLRLVDVPVYPVKRRQGAQLVERSDAREVACVQNEVGTRDQFQAVRREPASATRQVRIGKNDES
jgi:hypothetical protein